MVSVGVPQGTSTRVPDGCPLTSGALVGGKGMPGLICKRQPEHPRGGQNLHLEAQGSRRESSKKPRCVLRGSYGLASDVTKHHFYHILLVTGQPQGQPDSTLSKACGMGDIIVSIFAKIPSASEEREKASDKQ